jgi:hypothetical protein
MLLDDRARVSGGRFLRMRERDGHNRGKNHRFDHSHQRSHGRLAVRSPIFYAPGKKWFQPGLRALSANSMRALVRGLLHRRHIRASNTA